MKEVMDKLEVGHIIELPNGSQTKTENLIKIFGKGDLISLDYNLLINKDKGELGYNSFFNKLKEKGILD